MSAKPDTLARTVAGRSGNLKRGKTHTNEGLEAAARLLTDWGLESLHEVFQKHEIDVDCFKVMIMDDINELIPAENLGMRIKFRKRLLEWRHVNKIPIPIAESSTNRSVISWLLSQIGPSSCGFTKGYVNDTASENTAKPSDQMPSSSKDISIDLESLLNQSVMGKNIIVEYQKNDILSPHSRNDLCTLIADHWLAFSYQNILHKHYSDAASEIVRLFPKESTDTYISGTRKQGKLVQRLYNLSRKYREKGLVESRKHKILADDANGQDAKRRCLAAQQNPTLIASKVWLKTVTSLEPFVMKQWAETRDLRLATTGVQEMLKDWPIILQGFGASLIEMDFDQLYPTKDQLFAKFPEFTKKIKSVYWNDIKDEPSKAMLSKFNSSSNPNSSHFILINLLAAVLVPTMVTKTNDNKTWKPTILDAQNQMFIHLENAANIRVAVVERRLYLMKKGLTTQPIVVVVGPIENLTKFYVSCFGKLYVFDNFLKTLSVAFKIYNVFKFEYPKPCKQVWEFIQCYFFDLAVVGKRTNALIALLAELKDLPQSAA